MSMRWVHLETSTLFPVWARNAALDDDGTVWAPSILGDDTELSATLRAAWDGVAVCEFEGHVYLPTTWLAKEYPHTADICAVIAVRLRAFLAEESQS